jgi:hypothetical protein
MRLLGLVLLVAVLVVGSRQLTAPTPATDLRTVLSSQPTLREIAPPQNAPGVGGGLSAAEARGWCVANCEHHRFEELTEGGRTIVHMTTGIAATLNVPAGISIDGWDCYQAADAVGPVQWTGCEATFRRI